MANPSKGGDAKPWAYRRFYQTAIGRQVSESCSCVTNIYRVAEYPQERIMVLQERTYKSEFPDQSNSEMGALSNRINGAGSCRINKGAASQGDSADLSAAMLRHGMKKYNAGLRESAYELFKKATNLDPNNELAWLCLSATAPTVGERLSYLNQVLEINPHNQGAVAGVFVCIEEMVETDRFDE